MLAAAVVGVVTVALAQPVQATAEATYSGWNHREDARAPGEDASDSLSGAAVDLRLYSWDDQVAVVSGQGSTPRFGANFVPPVGQTLQAGATFPVEAMDISSATSKHGELLVWRDSTMCGRTSDELDQLNQRRDARSPALGWFRVDEITYDADGNATSFAATYEMNCQFLDAPAGFEGSVAVNESGAMSPVPDKPTTPGPIVDLQSTNVGPDNGGTNATTLTWTNPADYQDVTVDMVQTSDATKFSPQVGTRDERLYQGRASRFRDPYVEFMDTRTYRVVARGSTGRLGPASLLTVMGTRINVPDRSEKIMIGEPAVFTGRLSESWDYIDFADVMNGPPVPGKTLLMCEQPSVRSDPDSCNPVDRAKTAADGSFTLSVRPAANSYYSVVLPASDDMLGNWGYVISAWVAPHTDLRAREAQAARASASSGSVIHFTTSRARRGSKGFVKLQRFDGHSWDTVITKSLGHGSARLPITYREKHRGLNTYRIVKRGDARHINGVSRLVRVRVG